LAEKYKLLVKLPFWHSWFGAGSPAILQHGVAKLTLKPIPLNLKPLKAIHVHTTSNVLIARANIKQTATHVHSENIGSTMTSTTRNCKSSEKSE